MATMKLRLMDLPEVKAALADATEEIRRLRAALTGYRATWHIANGHGSLVEDCPWSTCRAIAAGLPVADGDPSGPPR